jgi:hypothetical protein
VRAARANRVFCTDEKRIRTENTVMNKSKDSAGISYKIVDWARMVFIRVQSTIRVDGPPSAQVRLLQLDVSSDVDRC